MASGSRPTYADIAERVCLDQYDSVDSDAKSVAQLLDELKDDDLTEMLSPSDGGYGVSQLNAVEQAIEAELAWLNEKSIPAPLFRAVGPRFAATNTPNDRHPNYRMFGHVVDGLRNIDARDFEALCGYVLALCGFDHITVTQESGDRGSDVFASLDVHRIGQGDSVAKRRTLLVPRYHVQCIGQAKRYKPPNFVTRPELDALRGAWADIENARANGELETHLSDALTRCGYRAGDATSQVFITTSRFAPAARESSKSLQIFTFEGAQVANLLISEAVDRGHPWQPGDAQRAIDSWLAEGRALL